jgi:ribonuclease D
MHPITTTTELAAACRRMATHPFVTIDTEFLRETTYYPLLCVAQMASPEEAVVIDALAPDIDLAPFFALMGDEKVMKVFHAARQDIEIVWHSAELIPRPIFDTQVAAMVLGYGDSISYEQLVQRVTGDSLDKSHRFTDWTRRPLSDAQLAYAISDVTHLRDVYQALVDDLGRRGRVDWVQEEMGVLTSADTYRMDPENAWLRLKTRVRKPKELAVLIEVAAWREREAQSRDVPRSRVLKDDVIGDIAVQAPTSIDKLKHLRSLPKGFERSRWGEAIVEAVERGLARDVRTLPRPRAQNSANGTAAPVQRHPARRDREGARRGLRRAAAGARRRPADRRPGPHGRLPQHGADHDLQPSQRRRAARPLPAGVPEPRRRDRRVQAAIA